LTARKRNGTERRASRVSCGLIQIITTSMPSKMKTEDPTSTMESTSSVLTSLTSLVTRVIVSPVRFLPW
jgi:hypothetical protein